MPLVPLVILACLVPQETEGGTLGRFTYQLQTGVEFSQDREEFSETNLLVRFMGDTSWRRHASAGSLDELNWSLLDVHTLIDLQLASIPAMGTDATGEEFLASKKAVTFSFGLESRLLQFPEVRGHVLYLGPLIRGGFQTLTESPDDDEDIDTVENFFGAGFRIGDCDEWSLDDDESAPFNPSMHRYVEVYYGHYENLDGRRWTFDAMLRTQPQQGLFLGAKALVGDGEDDVRVYAGVNLNPEGLQQMFAGLANLFAPDA